MARKVVINRILILIVICFGVELKGICQIKVVSTNYKEGNSIGYYRRSNPQDTVLVIFNSEHRDVEKSLRRWTFKDEELKDEIFKKKYPLLKDSCIELKFIHHPGPPMYNEIYSIDKANLRLDTLTLLEESEIPFIFWFENDPFLFEKTLILVNSDDWSRKEKNIKGIGVQIYTTGSCKDLIEKNQEIAIDDQLGRDPRGIPKEFYKKLAQEGLMDEDVRGWVNKDSIEKVEILKHINNAIMGTKLCQIN